MGFNRLQMRKDTLGGLIPFGSITGLFSAHPLLSNLSQIVAMGVRNRTGQTVELSLDGINTWCSYANGEFDFIDLGANAVEFNGTIYIRYPGTLGTTGSVSVKMVGSN